MITNGRELILCMRKESYRFKCAPGTFKERGNVEEVSFFCENLSELKG